jgi:flagellin-like protein
MKGVSEVIAIILILMIVIALAALAYTWFSGIFTQLTGTAGQTIQSTTTTMGTQFSLEAAACAVGATPACDALDVISMSIRNTGQPIFDATKTTFYIDGAPFTGAACSSPAGCTANALANGCTYSCTKARVAADPQPRCPMGTTTATISTMKAVIATGLEQSEIIAC